MWGRKVLGLLAAVALAGCAMHGPARPQPLADDELGAGSANLWYMPGRVFICGTSAVMAGFVMTVTLGQSHEAASQLMHGACSGPWAVEAQDVRKAVP